MKDSLFSVEEGESVVSSIGTLVSDACDFRRRGIGVEAVLGISWRGGEARGSASVPIPFTAETALVGVETDGGARRDAVVGGETLPSFPLLRTGVDSGDPVGDIGVGIPGSGSGIPLGGDAPVEIFSTIDVGRRR